MKIYYDILFGIGCAAGFIAVVSIVCLIIEIIGAYREEMKYLDEIEKLVNEEFEKLKENENADRS